jgi:hypothetical protein
MADLSVPDDIRIEKLRRWLEGLGIDVVQVGDELTMPSPFKEREKRAKDGKRRLSMTIVKEGTIPTLRWQCWWSRSKTGKAYGGRSCYALSVLTKVPQAEIAKLLDLHYDEQVEQAETSLDKVTAILTQPVREAEARRVFREQTIQAQQTVVPHLLPGCVLSLWEGNPLTSGPEQMVEARGIHRDVGHQYGLGWDYDRQAIFIPWADQSRTIRLFQWWDGTKYRFPRDEPGKMTKSDAILGLHLWQPGRPMLLAEGAFTGMSICGCALGGSALSDTQLDLIAACIPDLIVPAFDNDHGGFDGAIGVSRRLSTLGCRVAPVFCPEGNDWNDFLRRHGFESTMKTLAERIENSMSMSNTSAIATQYRGGR